MANKDFCELSEEEKKEVLNICCGDEILASEVLQMDSMDVLISLSNLYTRVGRDHSESKRSALRIFDIRMGGKK